TRTHLARWSSALRATVGALRSAGARVIEISDQPRLAQDQALCLSRPGASLQGCGATFGTRFAQVDAAAERASGAAFIDVEPWFCVSPSACPVIVDDRIVYHDTDHITSQYAHDLAA